jgi:lysophospholipase L1-like esterase
MRQTLTRLSIIIAVATLFAFITPPRKVKVYLIGDSTISEKKTEFYPETGWGMPFKHFFDTTVVVDNRAMNGRSTRTFISEGRWQSVMDSLREGDYVFIQFGHNDEWPEKVDRYTDPETYKKNLRRFIQEARDKKATPVLLTPVARRRFENGIVKGSHDQYSALVREVAKQTQVAFIDLDKVSQELLTHFGEEDSKLLFLHLQPGEHPNYPDGKKDDTHFNELGARKVAQLVLRQIQELKLPLAEKIKRPAPKP